MEGYQAATRWRGGWDTSPWLSQGRATADPVTTDHATITDRLTAVRVAPASQVLVALMGLVGGEPGRRPRWVQGQLRAPRSPRIVTNVGSILTGDKRIPEQGRAQGASKALGGTEGRKETPLTP